MTQTDRQKVLIVDDGLLNRQLLSELLRPDHSVILAKNGEQALERAMRQQPDLILLDVVMPEMDGYEVLRQLKADKHTSSIPVIFITAQGSPEEEANGLLQGAMDYITKPFNPYVVRARVATQLKLARQRHMLEMLANIDGLTELPNRRHFDNMYETEWLRAKRYEQPLSVALLDVDNFKLYNDHYGHAMGDLVLQAVAKTLTGALKRPSDLAARYGGEEFVLILPETDVAGALQVAESVRAEIERLAIAHQNSPVCHCVTVSIGLACSMEQSASTAAAMLKMADDRLYLAKNAGRNCVANSL